ncbi:uncharacterized protein LOC143601992 [Bidens hawaiensis]|uniref:uncharacterized protein LOC143601992 n=1 Tax=Bidens hawaiensis TaxID=980011 RepID=UPI00404A626B
MSSINHAPPMPPTPVVAFKNFNDAKPTAFDGTQCATALLQWYEKMASVFLHIECPDDKRTRFASSVFEKGALTWWVKEKSVRGAEAAMTLPWNELKDLMTRQFCSPNELMNLEAKFWNLKQEGGEHTAYTSRFNELSWLVPHLVTLASYAIDKYIRGLPREIQDSVLSSSPKELDDAINLAATLTDNNVKAGTLTMKGSKKNPEKSPPEPRETKPELSKHAYTNHINKRKHYALTQTQNTQPQPSKKKTLHGNTPFV